MRAEMTSRAPAVGLLLIVAVTGCAFGAWAEDHWRHHLESFTATDAKCLGPAEAGQLYRCYVVEFSVGGEPVGSLTRLRCRGATCAVAGTGN